MLGLSSVLHISFWCLRIISTYFQNPNSPFAEKILLFSDGVMLLIIPIAFGVLYYILRLTSRFPLFRKLTDNQALEFFWTLVPMVALICLSFPSLSLLYLADEVGKPCLTFKIQAHQWYWVYETKGFYLDSRESHIQSGFPRLLNTDSALVVPSSLPLRFLATSADILHSWTIPSWGLKADAIPGRVNQISIWLERPGKYYGQCSELCGSNHSFIPIVSEVFPRPSCLPLTTIDIIRGNKMQ